MQEPPRWRAPEVTLLAPAEAADREAAARCGLRVVTERDPSGWQLVRVEGALVLRGPGPAPLRLALDPRRGSLARRLGTAHRNDALPRAVGLARRASPPFVVDATAGLCRDAMVLAKLGCRVVALERIPALALLAQQAARDAGFGGRLEVVAGDALDWLGSQPPEGRPDVVCLDPMFTEPGKAQVKKEMQVCRQLAGRPADEARLFALAVAAARERVVVKRGRSLPPLGGPPSFAVAGDRVRFDVYLTGQVTG
ncbi:MAG: rRNA methyltransferase [Planctomycetes bacterium]|nr:rRNA methyltransferase [Planctomycetota bacterium]